MTAIDSPYNDNPEGKPIIGAFQPAMTKNGYLAFVRGIVQERAV
jgi:hypothetical protein